MSDEKRRQAIARLMLAAESEGVTTKDINEAAAALERKDVWGTAMRRAEELARQVRQRASDDQELGFNDLRQFAAKIGAPPNSDVSLWAALVDTKGPRGRKQRTTVGRVREEVREYLRIRGPRDYQLLVVWEKNL